jgi:hypothetical protein
MAFQDSWAKPTADELVDLFRVDSFTYIRKTNAQYDPETGVVSETEKVYTKAGAVTKSGMIGQGSVGKTMYLEAWMNTASIDEEFPTTDDFVQYNNRTWNIVQVDPMYSGDILYAAKIRAES